MTPSGAAQTPPQVTVNANGTPGAAPATPKPAGAPTWTEGFDADLAEFVSSREFKDPKTLAESYRNLEKLRGVTADKLLKLPELGDDKGWNEVYTKLGKPPTPEGYGFKPNDPANPGFTDWAKDTFHKLNLTAEQGQTLVKQFNEFTEAQHAQAQAQHTAKVQEQVVSLKKEWGAAFQQNVNRAQAAYRQFGIPDAAIDSLEKAMGFDGVMKVFHSLGSKVGEHTFVGSDGGPGFGDNMMLTPDQAQAKIKALKKDGDWTGKYLKGDIKARTQMEQLLKMAYPQENV